ncbi:type IV secretion system DNA-binding domain-containing protein [Candidatus Falkowbacteria bacterium]|nr:type IV secretion system DNA-binding domain-containing protein [Candidatus Falkowbacteria bacterium]
MQNLLQQLDLFGIQGSKEYIFLGLILVIAIVIIYLVLLSVKFILRLYYKNSSSFRLVVLSVLLPKYEVVENKEAPKPKSQQELAEKISAMETFFANIAGMRAQRGFKYFFVPRNDHMGFEIVLKNGLIYFYVVVPINLKQFIEQQIAAQFPHAVIEEVEDYNIFNPQGVISGAMLKFKKEYIYPIKTYRKSDTDTLSALTSALSKLDPTSGAAIQIIARSSTPDWHKWGQKTASMAHQGKKVSQAIAESRGSWQGKMQDFVKYSGLSGEKKKEGAEPPKQYQLSAMEQEILKGIEEKAAKGGLDINIRVLVSSDTQEKANLYLENILNSFAQFNIYEYGNAFKRYSPSSNKLINDFIYREFDESAKMIMNTEETTSIFHFPLGHIETPNIVWLAARKAAPPTNMPKEGILLGINEYRAIETEVRIKREDRRRHLYIIGMTGTGKTFFQNNLIIQDIINGEGVCVIDPHGDLVEEIINYMPKERAEDVIYFNPSDTERPMALNMLEFYTPEQKTFVINEMMNIFDKLYDLKATGGPIFEQYMRNAMLLIMEDPESGNTLMEIPKVLSDEEFRKYKLSKTKTAVVKDFWIKEAEKAGGEAALANVVPYITSKLTSFIANDIMRPIIAQQKSAFNFRQAMDEKKIILVNLAKGKLGDINSNLLGMVIIGKILMAALSRVDMPEQERKDFYLYIDEFQNFLTEGIQVILSEARKYRLCLTIAHQFIGQLVKPNDTRIKDAIFGNVGTKIAFRIGVDDAEIMAKEFAPIFNEYDVMNVPKYNAFTKILIDNANPPPFNMKVLGSESRPVKNPELASAIKELSRLKYGRPREIVEAEIIERAKIGSGRDILSEAEKKLTEEEEEFIFK